MKTSSAFVDHVNMAVRLTAPYVLLLALFLLGVVALPFSLAGSIEAPLFLMGLYYWAIYRPRLMSPWIVFLAGCLTDLLSGLPLGLTALIYVVAQWAVTDQRRFLMGQNFIMVWLGFFILSLSCATLKWAAFGLMQFDWPPVNLIWISSVFGSALFPVIYILLYLTHKVLPSIDPAMRFSS